MKPGPFASPAGRRPAGDYLPYLLPLVVALAVRVLAWWILPYRGQISDEAEYLAAATWLANGRGFSFYKAWIWTRPPLYLLFLAAHIRLFGPGNLLPIRISQTAISVVTVALAMAWGARLAERGHERRVALTTGWAMALCYGFATYAFLLLSETLFVVLLLLGLLLLTLWAQTESGSGGRRRKAGLLAAGGVALGLGALTRALLAGALPLVAAWVWWQAARTDGQRTASESGTHRWAFRRGIAQTTLLTAAVCAVILPWTFWNSRFYGGNGLILIDTTGGYNALLGAQAAHQELEPAPECGASKSRCEKELYRLLKAVPDQAKRQSKAYRLAVEWIAANPGGFVRKTVREMVDLVTINYGGAERLSSGYTQGIIPIPHLLALLADDTLYLLAAPLAIAGLVRRQGRPGKGLALMWLSYNLVTGPLFFAINRFRVPLLPVLFIYGACALAQWRERWTSTARQAMGLAGAGALLLFLLPSFGYWGSLNGGLPASDGPDSSILLNTYLGIRARIVSWDCTRAEAALTRNDLAAAQHYIDRGSARRVAGNNGLDCFALLQARIDAARGESGKALALLQSMNPIPERFLLEGEIYQRLGQRDRALGAFVRRDLEEANPTTWAWNNLHPPPTTRVDLGSGFDWGYVDAFYGREGRAEDPGNFRWTAPRSRLRFVGAGTGAPQTLRMRVSGGHRDAVDPAPQLTVISADASGCSRADTIDISPVWRTIDIPICPTAAGHDVIVELRSTTFLAGPGELAQRQQVHEQLRLLGVQVDWAELHG